MGRGKDAGDFALMMGSDDDLMFDIWDFLGAWGLGFGSCAAKQDIRVYLRTGASAPTLK